MKKAGALLEDHPNMMLVLLGLTQCIDDGSNGEELHRVCPQLPALACGYKLGHGELVILCIAAVSLQLRQDSLDLGGL